MKTIEIPVQNLKQCTSGFTRIISRHSTLPVLGCLRLQSRADGMVHLTATNLDDFATYTIQSASSLEPMDVLVPFEPLSKIIKGCSADDTITIGSDKKQLVLTYPVGASRLEQKFDVIATDEFPAVPEVKEYDCITVGQEFKEAILSALSCTSSDESRFILQNAYVDVSDPKAHYVVGTDGRHLFSANSFTLDVKDSFTIPDRRFLTWKGFIEDGDWRITLPVVEKDKAGNDKPSYIKVQSDHWTLLTRRCDLPYPHWRAPIPNPEQAKTVIQLTDEAVAFIRKAAPRLPGANQLSSGVTIQSNKSVILTGNDGTQAASVPIVGAVAEGEPINVSLNRSFLIKAMELQLKVLQIHGPTEPLVFTTGGRRLVVMPLRPDGPPPQPQPTENDSPTAPAQDNSSPEPAPSIPKEQTTMKANNRIEEVSTQTATNGAAAAESAFDHVRIKLEQTRTAMKEMITDLNDALKLLAQAQRERRSTEKEIEEVRTTLQSLQKIRI